MSTHNIPNVPMARTMLRTTAKDVRKRVETVQEETLELDKAEVDVRIGAAAMLQSIADDRGPLLEEIGQLQGILDSIRTAAPVVVVPEPEPEPEPTPVPPAPAPEPAVPSTPPVRVPFEDAGWGDRPYYDDRPVAATPTVTHFRVRDTWRYASVWKRTAIVLVAIVGLFIFLLVGKATSGIIRWGTSGWWSWLSNATVIVWSIVLIVGGFGLGGWLTARWFARHH